MFLHHRTSTRILKGGLCHLLFCTCSWKQAMFAPKHYKQHQHNLGDNSFRSSSSSLSPASLPLISKVSGLKAIFSIEIRKVALISHECPVGFEKMVSSIFIDRKGREEVIWLNWMHGLYFLGKKKKNQLINWKEERKKKPHNPKIMKVLDMSLLPCNMQNCFRSSY